MFGFRNRTAPSFIYSITIWIGPMRGAATPPCKRNRYSWLSNYQMRYFHRVDSGGWSSWRKPTYRSTWILSLMITLSSTDKTAGSSAGRTSSTQSTEPSVFNTKTGLTKYGKRTPIRIISILEPLRNHIEKIKIYDNLNTIENSQANEELI